MILSLFSALKNVIFPFLKIDETSPKIPYGHEEDVHLQVLRADTLYWNYVLTLLGIYAFFWVLGMVVVTTIVLISIPVLAWIVLPIIVLATAKMIIVLAVHRIDYELRWYIITDSSITVRQGAWTVQEITVSYQNVQNVRVTQGPLERMFGFANVLIDTAGNSGTPAKGKGANGHHAVLRGITNAQEIRDVILHNLRSYRNSGLGDPDDILTHKHTSTHEHNQAERTAVLQSILLESRNLRSIISNNKGLPTIH